MQADKSDQIDLTLFTTAKPFAGHSAIIQRNALGSWSRLQPRPEILLIGDEEGYEEAAAGVGAVRVPDLERNEFGTPLVSEIFRSGRERGTGRVPFSSTPTSFFRRSFLKQWRSSSETSRGSC